ncbi:MAG TPA: acetyltransferase [Saprospiraceae bacterium]|nr:acetyltransferase [Saprospiraceae bacterium]
MTQNTIVGYGGHAYMVCDIMKSNGQKILGYFEQEKKTKNPFHLTYLGRETDAGALDILRNNHWFVAFDNNHFRKFITEKMLQMDIGTPRSIVHKSTLIPAGLELGFGSMIAPGVIINTLCEMGNSVIINTHATIGYECTIGDYAHIATGAVLANNVRIGERSFVGANAVVKEGVIIGDEVRIGAGSVIVRDVESGCTVVGNPARIIDKKNK